MTERWWWAAENDVAFKWCSVGIKRHNVCLFSTAELHHHHNFFLDTDPRCYFQQLSTNQYVATELQGYEHDKVLPLFNYLWFGQQVPSVASFLFLSLTIVEPCRVLWCCNPHIFKVQEAVALKHAPAPHCSAILLFTYLYLSFCNPQQLQTFSFDLSPWWDVLIHKIAILTSFCSLVFCFKL